METLNLQDIVVGGSSAVSLSLALTQLFKLVIETWLKPDDPKHDIVLDIGSSVISILIILTAVLLIGPSHLTGQQNSQSLAIVSSIVLGMLLKYGSGGLYKQLMSTKVDDPTRLRNAPATLPGVTAAGTDLASALVPVITQIMAAQMQQHVEVTKQALVQALAAQPTKLVYAPDRRMKPQPTPLSTPFLPGPSPASTSSPAPTTSPAPDTAATSSALEQLTQETTVEAPTQPDSNIIQGRAELFATDHARLAAQEQAKAEPVGAV